MSLIDEAYNHAIKVLQTCSRPVGFFASGLPGGYEALWARDSMITSLGAMFAGKKFVSTIQKSFQTLSKNQSSHGQIPNCVGDFNLDRQSDVTFNTIDSTLWYLIGHQIYAKAFRDKSLLKKYNKHIERAMLWLRYQDPNEDNLLAQQPTMDWQDAFPHKYGHAINTMALYYGALKMYGKNALAKKIQSTVNGTQYNSMYDKEHGHYLPWVWKNHDGDREQGAWFDTLGNLLAIITGLADEKISNKILEYIDAADIQKPYPCKAMYPPIREGGKEWHSYFSKCDAKDPYHYLNAGVWPFIGGMYVSALVKTKQFSRAGKELENLAMENKLGAEQEWEFNEWIDGQDGKAMGTPYQGWSAGMYIFAYHCVKQGKVPIF